MGVETATDKELNELVGSLNLKGIQEPFTVNDAINSPVMKNKSYVGKVYQNNNVAGDGFNSTTKATNSLNEIIEPEYDLCSIAAFTQFSDSLAACIEAYAVNIGGARHEYTEEIETIMENGKRLYKESREPVPAEIDKELKTQLARVTMFFNSVSLDMPWLKMKKLRTRAKHKTGNTYLEVERAFDNTLQGLRLVESPSIRLCVRSTEVTYIKYKVKDPTTFKYVEQKRGKCFRKFVQYQGTGNQNRIYFKEFGDPRVMNKFTGECLKIKDGDYITDINQVGGPVAFKKYLDDNNIKFGIATELIHWKIDNTEDLDGYGLIIWACLIPILLGVKFSDLADYNTLENKGIPDYMMIVEGAKAGEVIKSFKENVAANKELKEHKNILIISVDSTFTGSHTDPNFKNPTIRLEPLNQLLVKDGLLGKANYVEKVNERVAGVFRLPTFFIGKLNNVNRSVAEVAKDMANEQVFTPEIMDDDDIINMLIMPELDCSYYRYHTKSNKMENPELKAKTLREGIANGSILPGEGREEYAEILDRKLPDLELEFMKTPLPETLKGKPIQPKEKKLIELENGPDAEVFQGIKKRFEEANPGKVVKEMFIYAE
jgi:capsid portal protein